jgi:5-aminolevulinate synthase
MAGIEKCPHAGAARAAARIAEDLAAAAKDKEAIDAKKKQAAAASSKAAAVAGCPFHEANRPTAKPAEKAECNPSSGFNYENFYDAELEKKHRDQSYRYFNNINRLAAKFPVAHTSDVKEEVEVWCANDYLGMGNNPVVLETIQCVFPQIY